MSDHVLEQLHAWRSEHATDGLTPLDLDTIVTRGRRRRRVRHGLTVAIPTAVGGLLLVGTFGLVDARTSAQTVRPAEPPPLHSTVVELSPGQHLQLSADSSVAWTPNGICYDLGLGMQCVAAHSGPPGLSITFDWVDDPTSATEFIISGTYVGPGVADVVIDVPGGRYAATVVGLDKDPGWVAYYVSLPQLGNEAPTVRAYDSTGQLLAQTSVPPVRWVPPSVQEMRDSCQLAPSLPVVANHPVQC